jgi:hypothetical protein
MSENFPLHDYNKELEKVHINYGLFVKIKEKSNDLFFDKVESNQE